MECASAGSKGLVAQKSAISALAERTVARDFRRDGQGRGGTSPVAMERVRKRLKEQGLESVHCAKESGSDWEGIPRRFSCGNRLRRGRNWDLSGGCVRALFHER